MKRTKANHDVHFPTGILVAALASSILAAAMVVASEGEKTRQAHVRVNAGGAIRPECHGRGVEERRLHVVPHRYR